MSDGRSQPVLILHPPVYILVSEHECWPCHKITPVITLATARAQEEDRPGARLNDLDDDGGAGFYVLSNVGTLPDRLLAILQEYCQGYRYARSEAGDTSYFMNHCLRCDTPLDDRDLHDEPGSAFFPETAEDCDRLVLVELPLTKPCVLASSYAVRADSDFILRHSARETYRST